MSSREFIRLKVTRTPYNQYDSLTVPLHHYLTQHGVDFNMKCTVTDLDFKEGRGITVTKIHYVKEGSPGTIELNDGDLVIVTNGSMTEGYSLGSMTSAPSERQREARGSYGIASPRRSPDWAILLHSTTISKARSGSPSP